MKFYGVIKHADKWNMPHRKRDRKPVKTRARQKAKLAIALALLCSCAQAPASLPFVRIDRSLSGPVCSREAAEALLQRRTLERAAWEQKILDCQERANVSEARAERAQWWERNAPWLIAVAGVIGASAGVALAIGIMR
jgi:hypothetical protein